MSKIIQLKEQARALEQREQWKPALEVYESLVAQHPDGDELDVGIWNRIGDLHIRLGQTDRAVTAYERAVHAYADSGLHNNAIALCNKILRLTPGRPPIYLKLGLISAAKGFLSDTHYYLGQFVDRMRSAGRLEAALENLAESAAAQPNDLEIRRFLIEQLRTAGDKERAVEELTKLREQMLANGMNAGAEAVLEQIREFDPDAAAAAALAPLPEASVADAAVAQPPAAELDVEIRGLETADLTIEADAEVENLELESLVEDSAAEADLDLSEIMPLAGFESTHSSVDADEDDSDPLPGFDAPPGSTAEFDLEEEAQDDGIGEISSDPLPLLDAEATDDSAAAEFEPLGETGELDVGGALDEFELHRGEDAEEDGEDSPLPVLEVDATAEELELPNDDPPSSGLQSILDVAAEVEAEGALTEPLAGVEEDPVAAAGAAGDRADDAAGEDGYVDLNALIFGDDEENGTTRFVIEAEEPTGDEDRDFAEILARFRAQVAQNIEHDDAASHSDLGVAFKEMGLFDEAISEFQTALRAGANPLATLEMLGECFVAKEQHAVGWRLLDRAVRLADVTDAELVGVVYWLGRCDEALGRVEAACESYERILSVDIRFRDTAERLRELRSAPGSAAL